MTDAQAELSQQLKSAKARLQELREVLGRDFVRPVPGAVIAPFGATCDGDRGPVISRQGVELAARAGQKVVAFGAGRVVRVERLPEFGYAVIVAHGAGLFSLTARLGKLSCQPGQSVLPGTVIGEVSTHRAIELRRDTIYFELREGFRPVDPSSYLDRAGLSELAHRF